MSTKNIIINEFLNVTWENRFGFLLLMVGISSSSILGITVPLFYKDIANGFAVPYTVESFNLMIYSLTIILIFHIGIWLSWRLVEIGIIVVDIGGVRIINKRCFNVMNKQNYNFFENSFTGSLIKKSSRFSRAYEDIIGWIVYLLIPNVIGITVASIMFYHYYPEFAYYFITWVVVFLSFGITYSMWSLKWDKAVAVSDSKFSGAFADSISNISTIKSYAISKLEQANIDDKADDVYYKTRRAWIYTFISFAIQGIMMIFIEILLVYFMILKWKDGSFNVGEFVLFQSILLLLIERLWVFTRNVRTVFTAYANALEMAEILAITEYEQDSINATDIEIKKSNIEFKNVDFSYTTDGNSLFNGFNLNIKAGEKVAIVGSSGSGKTSLTKLLFRFLEPTNGKVMINDIDVKDFTLTSLREQLILVSQHPELFHRSIKDNITLNKSFSDEQIRTATQKAQCLEFIERLPNGFETSVGEKGLKLSGGEKQRIALARAFLHSAPIIVLDEPTSALDSITEQQIQHSVLDLLKNKTAIVIAHRLSTINVMDRIIVMHNGMIVEQGTHSQLIKNKGRYSDMWKHQSDSLNS